MERYFTRQLSAQYNSEVSAGKTNEAGCGVQVRFHRFVRITVIQLGSW